MRAESVIHSSLTCILGNAPSVATERQFMRTGKPAESRYRGREESDTRVRARACARDRAECLVMLDNVRLLTTDCKLFDSDRFHTRVATNDAVLDDIEQA
jgi:hypothetical protein